MSETFHQFCTAHGVHAPLDLTPGKWTRCPTAAHPKKKNASVKLTDDGRAGFCHDFSSMGEPAVWRANGVNSDKPAPVDHAEIAARQKQRVLEMASATAAARRFYETCQTLRGAHPYLYDKGLDATGCTGLRVSKNGVLVVPMCARDGSISSIQSIQADASKLFWSGAPTKGTSHRLHRAASTLTIFTEGLATGLALFAAVPESSVIVCFSASNLPIVASESEPRGLTCIAGDNDHRSVCQRHRADGITDPFDPCFPRPEWCRCNPGKTAAKLAAEKIGADFAMPECEEGTDFNDMLTERLLQLREENMFRKGHKLTERELRKTADSEIRLAIMRNSKFIPYPQ